MEQHCWEMLPLNKSCPPCSTQESHQSLANPSPPAPGVILPLESTAGKGLRAREQGEIGNWREFFGLVNSKGGKSITVLVHPRSCAANTAALSPGINLIPRYHLLFQREKKGRGGEESM